MTAEVSKLQTDTPEVGNTLSTQSLLDLPLSFGGARLAENFAYKITPGVTGNSWKSNINGSSHFSKETLVDGVTITTHRAGDFGQASISIEALQEFRIQTSGMSAEYGRAQGGVFNYVMKSGTNQVHGSGFVGLRNEAFNANSFANNARGAERNLDRRLAFAGSVGGPVVIPKIYDGRNRTFFHAAYERFRQRQFGFGSPNVTAPQPEWLNGDFSRLLGPAVPGVTDALGRPVLRGAIYDPETFRQLDNGRWVGDPFPGNRIPVNRFSRVSRNVVDMMRDRYVANFRQPDGTIPLQNNAFRPSSGTPEFDQHQFSVKADQIVNSNHRVSGSLSYTTRPRLLLDQPRLWDMSEQYGGPLTSARRQKVNSYLTRLAHDWNVSATMLNTASLYGSPQEFDRAPSLRHFPESDKLSLRYGQALRFEQQVVQILVSTSSSEERFDVAVDCFNDAEPHLHPTVVENAIDMIGEHEGQFVECGQALPAELKHPVLQVPEHRSFIGVRPQAIEALL